MNLLDFASASAPKGLQNAIDFIEKVKSAVETAVTETGELEPIFWYASKNQPQLEIVEGKWIVSGLIDSKRLFTGFPNISYEYPKFRVEIASF